MIVCSELYFCNLSVVVSPFIQCGVFDFIFLFFLTLVIKAVTLAVLQALNSMIWAGSPRGPKISDKSSASTQIDYIKYARL